MKIINDGNYPGPLMAALENNDYDFVETDNSISVTTLIDDPHIRKLRRQHADEVTINASDMIWALEGSAMHYVMERAGSEYIKELRITQEITIHGKVFKLSGKLDLLDIMEECLWDYKNTKVYNYIKHPEGDPKWIAQTNILVWLLKQRGITVKKIKILMFLKDWKETDYIRQKNEGYPPKSAMVVELPVLPETTVLSYIEKRLVEHFMGEETTECKKENRWAEPDIWSIRKEGAQRALKNCSSMAEAEKHYREMKDASGYKIVFVPGKDARCTKGTYCTVKHWCPYFINRYGNL